MTSGRRPDVPGSTQWDTAPCGYVRTADDGTVLVANDTMLRLLGRNRDEVVGRRFVDFLSGGARMYHETHFVPMLRMQNEVHALALDLRHADGRRVPVLVNARRGRDGDADADDEATIQIVFFDARERREYESELLRAKRRAEESEARATALSQTLQATLIPPLPPTIKGLEVATSYRPAGDGSEVGGDFYDVFQVANDDWVVAIGDVEGKGVQAAAVTALARHVIRAASVRTDSPRDALLTLNEVLVGAETTRLLTTIVLRLRRLAASSWSATVAAAGHAAPMIVPRFGPVQDLGPTGTILGAMPHPSIPQTEASFSLGDIVLLTTDGVAEAWSPTTEEFYGAGRVSAVVESLDHGPGAASRLVRALLADVLDFSDGTTRDDLAIVAFAVE